MMHRFPDCPAGIHIPEPNGTVVADRHDLGPVRTDCCTVNGALVSQWFPEERAGRRLPDGAVLSASVVTIRVPSGQKFALITMLS